MGGLRGVAGTLSRGDVRLYRFAPPDKQRPVLVLTRDSAIGHLTSVTVAPITLGRRVANLNADRMQEVCAALRFSLGCA